VLLSFSELEASNDEIIDRHAWYHLQTQGQGTGTSCKLLLPFDFDPFGHDGAKHVQLPLEMNDPLEPPFEPETAQ
jgi:hypothetical protein